MKFNKKILILICIILSAVMILCSCNVNTSTTNTKYKYVMIGNLKSNDEQTINGSVWRAILNNTVNTVYTYKYYAPASVSGSETKSYTTAFTDAAKKQIELAASGGAEIIILPSDAYSDAYLAVKENTKTYGNINFLILTVPGSSTSDVTKLNNKTTAVVINTIEYGYVFGYVLSSSGYKTIGYLGIEGKTSEDFIAGLTKGSKAAAEAKGTETPDIKSKMTNPDLADENARTLAAECDVIIGDETTQSIIAAAAIKEKDTSEPGKTDDELLFEYASVFEDEKAVMSFSVNCDVLTEFLTKIIKDCKERTIGDVEALGIKDNIFTLKTDKMSEEEISALFTAVNELGLGADVSE